MNKCFKEFATFVRLHDGYNKPKLNFQQMYSLFPNFEFTPCKEFGVYKNFGKAFGHKNLSMNVSYEKYTCTMIYKEYQDADESTAYVI